MLVNLCQLIPAEMNTNELASTIFYLMYEKHNYCGFNVNLKKPEKNNLKYKYAKDFINYFIEYKKNRDKRKKFINKNFDDLQTKLKDITKIKESTKNEIICQACNKYPFDIMHDQDLDLLKLMICGKCYGYGYQTKRDTQPVVGNYLVDIENPDYSYKKRMLKSLLNTADLGSASLILKLGKIQYKDSELKN